MIASSARKSSACDAPVIPRAGELHLWLRRRETAAGSDAFLREVLSRYTHRAPNQLHITRGVNGKPARDVLKLARRCFSAAELADLQACAIAGRSARFYEYWTLKEAHIKAAGGSLGRELEATVFALAYPVQVAGDTAIGSIVPLAPQPAESAWYCLGQALEHYRLALCCSAAPGASPGLRLFEITNTGAILERNPALSAVSAGPCRSPRAACQ
ncbi:MAG: 4-phosphopantetheinyl transferase family protein [Pseudomonadales bacterium]|nr:4-phosphopantetheinyl transferase family protein [Halioglobus sp.]MCP5121555.1 4-phosphopantetheinyl transferase family protein [Pseudomonadales bacterium]MCP5194899.1 4-phosphopantetheinyl transferase family protein [Pseudomonadales bacterium]